MKAFLLYCCPGTGGLFLTSIFAKTMNIHMSPTFSDTGHCHDLGNGHWVPVPGASFIGNYWEIGYKPNQRLYYSHVLPDDFADQNPNVEIVYIHVDSEDYRKVTELYVCKAWPALWTQQEYNKWVGPNYPPYSQDNIAQSPLIRTDLINDLLVTHTIPWFENQNLNDYHHVINFKTIMGLDNQKLDQVVADIVGLPSTKEISDYVHEYQQLNQGLYFQ